MALVRPGSEAEKSLNDLLEKAKSKAKEEAGNVAKGLLGKGFKYLAGKGKDMIMSHLGKGLMKF